MLAGPHLRLYIHKSFRTFLPHLRGRVCFSLVLFPISSNIYILTCRQSEALFRLAHFHHGNGNDVLK